MQEVGRLSVSVLRKATKLVSEIMSTRDQEFAWLADIMLGSIPVDQRDFARELMASVGDRCPVRFFRADVLSNGQIAELQCPGSGWAYNLALEEFYGIEPTDSSVVRAYRSWAKDKKVTWWLHDAQHRRSVKYLVDACRRAGMDLTVHDVEDFEPEDGDMVIKRPPLPELIGHEKGRRLLRRWLDGRVELDLLPTMAPETKYLMALLRHPATRHLFTEEERALCPPTYLIDSPDTEVAFSNGCKKPIAEVFSHMRRGIVKYGGATKALRGGCHAVYNIGTASMKLPARLELMRRALSDYGSGEAWVLQEFVDARRHLPDIPRAQFVLFRPHYYVTDKDEVVMTTTIITCRSDWKVHARSDACLGLCA
ncbi:hypothetical protein KKA13_01655 [Patescibacteria group bacterium]|nr:hypothetical protein [Patescibacteria group bacterium]